MFTPEMMQAAQGMMSKMSPEDMKRMSEWAASMDPSVMENMMKSMGGANAAGMDAAKVSEQIKNMSPEQLRAGMTQAQNQMGAQKQYMYNAAVMLKNEGNGHIKTEKYTEALTSYNKALENIAPHAGDDVAQLRLSLLLNAALCHLKLKDFRQAFDTSEQALKINGNNVKALFRRGLARWELNEWAAAIADVKLAAKLSPEDKAIAAELTRLEKEGKSKEIDTKDVDAATKKVEAAAAAAKAAPAPSASSGGSSSSSSGGPSPWGGAPNMSEAVERLAKNPEMLEQATQMMKNMPKEDLERMMKAAPLPPGMDAATLRSQMEAVTQNPEMLKVAMESLKSLPEEDRRKLLSRQGLQGGDTADMDRVLENPELMQQMAGMSGGGGPGGEGPDPDAMLKMAEEMMKNMTPETLASLAKASGMELDEDKARMLKRMMPLMPWVLRAMRWFGYVKRSIAWMFTPRGRVVLAVIVVLVAVLQHYRSSG